MTVQELIEQLLTLDRNAIVRVYESDWWPPEASGLVVIDKDGKQIPFIETPDSY